MLTKLNIKKICTFFGLVFLTSCSTSDIPPKELEERQGLMYEANSQIPYSGLIKRHFRNGQTKFIGNYKDGKKEGLWECYYKNGQLASKGNYIDGKLNGLIEFYNEDGQLDVTGNMIDDKREGLWKSYHSGSWSGLLWGQGNYKDDKREGVWMFFDGNGQLENQMEYVNGIRQTNLWSVGGRKRSTRC